MTGRAVGEGRVRAVPARGRPVLGRHPAIRTLVLLGAGWLTLCPAAACRRGGEASPVDPRFAAGQLWAYRTRPGEEDSSLLVGRVERDDRRGVIVHVAINRLALGPDAAEGKRAVVFLPFTRDALEASVTELLDTGEELPGFDAAYGRWRDLAARGEADVFDVPVAEAIDRVAAGIPGTASGSPAVDSGPANR